MEIRINKMHLENFKCHKCLTLDFGGENATIYGDNATGKSSVFDAFTWLLFGKDSRGNGEKSIDIKPLNERGEVADHDAVTEVEAELIADGEPVTLKRSFREVWSTKRGSATASYDGNASEYYVNGVPVKATEFKARVAELVDEDKFKLLTTVNNFPETLHWQKRRETLFGLFGALEDIQIARADERFFPLLEAMNGMRVEEFKKVLAAKRKGLTTARNEIPARISECQKTIDELGNVDFDQAQEGSYRLSRERDELQKELIALRNGTAEQRKEAQLWEERAELRELTTENEKYRMSQKVGQPDTGTIRQRLSQAAAQKQWMQRQVENLKTEIARCKAKIESFREGWKQEKGREFDGSENCPTCGQRLPESIIQEVREAFQKEKEQKLQQIVEESDRCKENLREYEENLEEASAGLAEAEKTAAAAEKALTEALSRKQPEIEDMPGFQEKKQKMTDDINQTKKELDEILGEKNFAEQALRTKIRELEREVAEAQAAYGQKGALEFALKRIEALRSDAKTAAQELAEVEQLIMLAEEFSRFKASFLEDSINGRFEMARFRLFREQINGGVEDCCDVMYDGVPYIGLNNGAKINVGMDIINTISRAYGVNVPIFVDNAESVTDLTKTESQCIRLVVSENDKELRVKNG